MHNPVITFNTTENAKEVYDILKKCPHNGFPILNEKKKFIGLILRN